VDTGKDESFAPLLLLHQADGVSFRGQTDIGTAIEFAQRADTMIYSIRFFGRTTASRPVREQSHIRKNFSPRYVLTHRHPIL
jgi:hypothetical protein